MNIKSTIAFVIGWLRTLSYCGRAVLKTKAEIVIENTALRSQLSIFGQEVINFKIKKPRVTPDFRQIWVLLSMFWKEFLMLVKPETVIGWHNTAFKLFWIFKSKKPGRPKVSPATIALVKRIHKENPLLSPEKIHERLVDLAVSDTPAPNTIAKYIAGIRKPPSEKQVSSWKSFLKNHSKGIWAMDFFVVPSLTFKLMVVLLVIGHDRREIKHFAVTQNPSSAWVMQQIREATPYGEIPEYIIHDNDSIFTAGELRGFLENAGIKPKRTGIKCPWQNGICERAVEILRRELFDHVFPFNERHLKSLLGEYKGRYYNPVRTHQGIECQTPIVKEKPKATTARDTVLAATPILGGMYHSYEKVA